MNERMMNDEEKADNRKARKLAGLPGDGSNEVNEYGTVMDLYTATSSKEVGEDRKLHSVTNRATDIQVEWAKVRAQADRWREELILLEEEMQRSVVLCTWKQKWWQDHTEPRPGVSVPLAEGLQVYALEQVDWWTAKWSAVRERSALVLKDHVWNVEDEIYIPLEIELDDEPAGDEYNNFEEEY
ncbi:hypothetical protein B0H14DRAFT_2633766 [Mycena olivaceomarginata]|nr:hypothetical protein B0H14DRAFT_2633766 [Mycena olivaceomarginata]